jgi:phosphomethylpyrimidine synthase
MTQLEQAKSGHSTKEIEIVAKDEQINEQELVQLIASGRVVIPANIQHHNLHPVGIGKHLKTKVNANIGTSIDFTAPKAELEKLEAAIRHKADAVMDLSTGGDIDAIRKMLIAHCTLPFGNVPIYQMTASASKESPFINMPVDEMFAFIERQARDGVDFMTIHAGLTRNALARLKNRPRLAGIVSRGGAQITAWMLHNQRENPFYEHFDRLLEMCQRYDVTLSLGDGLRPGSLADGSDHAQIEELLTLGELVRRCHEHGVQVMVEGPGHLPIPQIEMNIKLQKALCDEAPFYVLGPVVTDIAPGYDHITAAIGGAIAATAGADFLCYVTPAEHLGLPDANDVKDGIIATRIAAHAADIAKGIPSAIAWDRQMASARGKLDWESQCRLSIDQVRFNQVRSQRATKTDACSMCGDFCVYKVLENFNTTCPN